MIQQKNRFHGHGSLRFVYKNGAAVRSSQCTVKFHHNPYRGESRFAVVISKKVLKSAVRRNRIRRRIYEIIRHELPAMQPSYDVVVLVFSSELYAMPHEELKKRLTELFSAAGLYKIDKN